MGQNGCQDRPLNARLEQLQPYPFEKLRALVGGVNPRPGLKPIRLSIGEPQHPTPSFIRDALVENLDGLSVYPTTAGSERLRAALAGWFGQRYGLPSLNPATQVLPVNGSREALFAFAQVVLDSSRSAPLVVCPNPFYQIYEGAALLAGARPVFLNQTPGNEFGLELDSLSATEWASTSLMYVCSPGNPTGRVLTLDDWQKLFALSDRHGFVIASDECYSEIYFDEQKPPLGALEAARRLGREDFANLVVFTSLSKRSNVPGMRSGAVAGDARLLGEFLRYRTYHGCAMSPAVQEASVAAWGDETHVRDNRDQYRAKFAAVVPILAPVLDVPMPDAAFYLWVGTPIDDAIFARDLLAETNVAVLPGQFLGREAHGVNPGRGFVRLALVAGLDECVEAAKRIVDFMKARRTV